MTDREQKVFEYYKGHNLLDLKFPQEKELLALAREMLDLLGAVHTRGKTDDEAGVADLLICYKGRYIAAEMKAANNEESMLQHKFIDGVRKAGGRAAVCHTLTTLFYLVIM